MSTLSKLFSGYAGGGHTAKNGKFSTTKNNHNRDKHCRPTTMYGYSCRYLVLWFGENEFKKIIEDAKLAVEILSITYVNRCKHCGKISTKIVNVSSNL